MPEREGRQPAFYDRETEEPRGTGRRRRQVADWGVDEHVFDRMPSPRFSRRGEERRQREPWGGEPRGEITARRRFDSSEERDEAPRDDFAGWDDDLEPRREEVAARDDFAGWDDEFEARSPAFDDDPEPDDDEDGRRTIVIGGAVEGEIPPPAGAPRERRTIVIGGHPDGLPVVRDRRPPRTAVERIGTSPDRIVAYAVALGFLLILIAILTTGH